MYPELTTPRLDSDGYLCAVCNDRLLFKDDNSLHSEDEATFSWSVSVQLMVFHADLASSQWVAMSRLGCGEALFVGLLCARLRADML